MVTLNRALPNDYPEELYSPWYEDPIYKNLDVKRILVYVGGGGMGDIVMIPSSIADRHGLKAILPDWRLN